ncbi:MAG: amino acid decarboxylase, partial [Clostridia bacterium]|nr:amino acid decarboxylase [Clostridia bacterium]
KPKQSKKVMSPKEAMLSPSEIIPIELSQGRVLSQVCITCPPAVPIAISGEAIESEHIQSFRYYNIKEISVIKNK